jgi:hypothetical protein
MAGRHTLRRSELPNFERLLCCFIWQDAQDEKTYGLTDNAALSSRGAYAVFKRSDLVEVCVGTSLSIDQARANLEGES